VLCCAEQREGVLDALLEDRVGELPVGKRPRKLNRTNHHGEDGEHLSACRLGIFRRESSGEVVGGSEQAVGKRAFD
jgi:hypothetical protein